MTKILIVEDNDIVLKVIKSILDKKGYSVTEAINGKEALEIMKEKEFDIVITDLMLPYVNGLELIQKIKTDVTKRNVKTIVVSAIGDEPTIAEAFKLGADDYLMKPIAANELVTRVRKLSIDGN